MYDKEDMSINISLVENLKNEHFDWIKFNIIIGN